jgi:prepilin-type N-terminal cleavage/methylation domain-containing protein/prepilin-type processing-associated H-X9-DG protein
MQLRHMHRSGFTKIELIVAITIIAILLAVTLPAIHSARESARRLQCQNNLRQILVATESHHTAHNALPSLYNGTALSYPLGEWDLFHMHSWRVPLLPYLEQTPLKEQINWNALATATENKTVAQTPVPTFICPSGGSSTDMGWGLHHGSIGVPPEKQQDSDRYRVVRSDYDAMAGIQVLPKPLPANTNANSVDFVRWGIWGWPVFETRTTSGSRLSRYRQGKFRDVTDGLSNTIAVVERAGKPIDLLNGKPNVTPSNPNADYPGQVGWSASNTFIWAINADGVGINESNSRGIYSFHSGGANVGIADGSVRFLADSMDFKTLVSLYGRSDGGLPE